ncbi:MAG: NADH-quinone oxidoreductase subunit NuoG [Gammaproteobacteria bacterium]|nr:NADH-quinone oxidoreductase subunit NuoG [Gammaproteobacteria bacterium]
MPDNSITIEIDGQAVEAQPGQMLIEVTDRIGNYVPRFCYHNKLSVAANCRMCLVEVEKAPKPLPACATPVADGMKVHTRSALAVDAQKSVMEFLLINHPLDCPICDQGGECELQDLAMGYGRDVSRYQENKRVVQDKNIGPLVQTDMTRCIHCTRCVRFGEEIAGLRELGATGRSEFMEIGTYIEKSMTSELSGNVIDLCPVGALTSKPFRFRARTWEMTQHEGVAVHDPIGSNIHFHVKNDQVKRVAPAENEDINEVWLSDRDRFSYEGLNSAERLTTPMLRDEQGWREVGWQTAIEYVSNKLQAIAKEQGAGAIGALISPSATSEECYLAQQLLRELGSDNIDHRLRQTDFTDQDNAPACPGLGLTLQQVEQLDAALIIGGFPRKDQPIFNHRLRKAARAGARVMAINPVDFDFNFELAHKQIIAPERLVTEVAAVVKAIVGDQDPDAALTRLLAEVRPDARHETLAQALTAADRPAVFIGSLGISHPHFSVLRYLGATLAQRLAGAFGCLDYGANSAGAWLAGAVPHRLPGMVGAANGLNAGAMLKHDLAACLLLNAEPELDFFDGKQARDALSRVECVIAVTGYRRALDYAHVLLPMALYAENPGSFLNLEGRRQCFEAAVAPPGSARPAWQIFCSIASSLDLEGFKYAGFEALCATVLALADKVQPDTVGAAALGAPAALPAVAADAGLERVGYVPMNSVDALVRHAPALQQTGDVADGCAHINEKTANRLELGGAKLVEVSSHSGQVRLPLQIDHTVADDCVLIHGGHADSAGLGPLAGRVSLTGVGHD